MEGDPLELIGGCLPYIDLGGWDRMAFGDLAYWRLHIVQHQSLLHAYSKKHDYLTDKLSHAVPEFERDGTTNYSLSSVSTFAFFFPLPLVPVDCALAFTFSALTLAFSSFSLSFAALRST